MKSGWACCLSGVRGGGELAGGERKKKRKRKNRKRSLGIVSTESPGDPKPTCIWPWPQSGPDKPSPSLLQDEEELVEPGSGLGVSKKQPGAELQDRRTLPTTLCSL